MKTEIALAVASVCIIIAILSPLASYIYVGNRFNEFNITVGSYKSQLSDLLKRNEKLRKENENLTQLDN